VNVDAPVPLVVDSCAIVALLADAGGAGDWAARTVQGRRLAAPHLVVFEEAPVVTLDVRLASSSGPRCPVIAYPGATG
jgi:predicted nucleic acid-binding protein